MTDGRDLLLLSHRTPVPPLTGSVVKPHHMARVLGAAGWRVHLRCFGDAAERDAAGAAWPTHAPASIEVVPLSPARAVLAGLAGLPRGRPLTDCWYDMPAMHGIVRAAIARHGIGRAVAFSSGVAQFVPESMRRASFMELCDLDSAKFDAYVERHRWPMAAVYRMEAGRLARREREIIQSFGACSLVSERERELLRARWPDLPPDRVTVMTNGVDVDAFSPDAARAALAAVADAAELRVLDAGASPYMVFTGVMDYRPNVEAVCAFARDVFPEVRRRYPAARFTIVGNRPAPEVAALAAQDGIRVTGFVQDVRPYLARADLAVIPLRIARGIQNKALEAMACGTPVACTPATHEGIGARPGQDYWLAEGPDQWLGAIERVVQDPAARGAMARSGRAYVVEHHSWDAALTPLLRFLERGA
jgi:sugar transferase (PEP-CTERM/EpsH1 system associated)